MFILLGLIRVDPLDLYYHNVFLIWLVVYIRVGLMFSNLYVLFYFIYLTFSSKKIYLISTPTSFFNIHAIHHLVALIVLVLQLNSLKQKQKQNKQLHELINDLIHQCKIDPFILEIDQIIISSSLG